MSEFSKQTEMKARLDKGDIHSVSMSGGSYSPSFSITTRTSDVITIQFANTQEMHDALNMLITAALKMDWSESYASAHVYNGDTNEIVTTEQVKFWRENHTDIQEDADA